MHRVAFVIYPGFELLDMSGPVAVFDGANHVLAQSGKAPFYGVEIISAEGGMVTSSSGVAVQALRRSALTSKRIDTLLVAGAQREHLMRATGHSLRRGIRAPLRRYAAIVPRHARGAFNHGAPSDVSEGRWCLR